MGRIWRALKLGMKSLLLHKLRSGLTVLGIVFGVAAVISMLAVGEGSSRKAQRQFAELGATNIIYRSVKPSEESMSSGGGRRMVLNYGLKYEDFDRLLATVPTIKKALPIRERLVDSRPGSFSVEETQLSQITLQVHSIDQVRATAPIIEAAVQPKHPKKDVTMVVPYDLLMQAQATARQFSIILGTIASISLLVGGIGIMNIMLATVTERTREIGIRRALGAKRKDITQQFLIETVVLSGVGGLLGVTVGITIPRI